MPRKYSYLIFIGCIVVAAVILGCAAYLYDSRAAALGGKPYVSCVLLPLWHDQGAPSAGILTLCGLLAWGWSRFASRIALTLMLVGILLGIGPLLMAHVLPAMC